MAQIESPDAIVAAGLLEGAGGAAGLSAGAATQLLRDTLTSTALWIRGGQGGQLPQFDPDGASPRSARWVMPVSPELDAVAVEDVWRRTLDSYHPAHPPLLRLTVPDLDAANLLAEIRAVSGIPIIPLIERPARPLVWHWPLRVGIQDGPRAAEWKRRLDAASNYVDRLYRTRILTAPVDDPVDILLVDVSSAERIAVEHPASSVIFVGDSVPMSEVLQPIVNRGEPIAVAGVPVDDVDWFREMIHELAHDQPLDAAILLAVPSARIAGDPHLVPLTGAGHWAAAVANQARWGAVEEAVADRLRDIATYADFRYEHGGASLASGVADEGYARGEFVELVSPMFMAGPPLEEVGLAPPDEVQLPRPPQPRRLFADFWKGDEIVNTALAPETEYVLAVYIAMPRGSSADGADFEEGHFRDDQDGGTVELDIDVIGPNYHEVQTITLPVADRTKASTVAAFDYTTGTSGKIGLRITVLYRKRPIQEVEIIGSIRANPLPMHRIDLARRVLSASREPDPDRTTAADVFLDWTDGSTLRRRGEPGQVPFANLGDILDRIESCASAALTAEGPAAAETIRTNLISLALLGREFREALDEVNVGEARTIAVQVKYNSPLLPLELAYDGPAPGSTAKLCEHLTAPPEGHPNRCTEVSERIVCPYAFWGTFRTIARTVQARSSKTASPPSLRPLSLRPVLWGATSRADEGAAPPTPSTLLKQALAARAGAEQVIPARNWQEWSRLVRKHHPQLLLVLGHTDNASDGAFLEIGHGGQILNARITAKLLRRDQAPSPLVLLIACATAVEGGLFGALPATFTANGAGAVVATLSKLRGPAGADAAIQIVSALWESAAGASGVQLGNALADARRRLLAAGNLAGLFLVSHGEIDIELTA